ncbi:hypothetical protein C2R22_23285 (plasmid) [Salinigranum rubrum]|uniref:DUF3892 domain-containing protein n=1 Tax=Salinigranum rubrum TaxID=755307 RepID=A0A2I8VRC9_9EURY|nr:hypothetical protein C2R22_23285 [Salinigranum rubrum]
MAYPVECVNTSDSSDYDDCRCITTIGIPSKGGGTNTYTPERIHDRIEDEDEEFYVEYQGSRTYLDAVQDGSTKYVRTEPNDTPQDNLLKQPSC